MVAAAMDNPDTATSRSYLCCLPPEIFSLIINQLLPDTPPTRVTQMDNRARASIHDNQCQYQQWQYTRKGLDSLYRASKSLARAVEPFVFTSIALRSPRQIKAFYQLLNSPEKSGLGKLVRSIYLIGDLRLSGCLQDVENNRLMFLARILQLTPYLNDFLISAPNDNHISFLMKLMCHPSKMDKVGIKRAGWASQESPRFMQSVRSLRLRHDVELFRGPNQSNYLRKYFSCDVHVYLKHFPNLETLELCGDSVHSWLPRGIQFATRPVKYHTMTNLKHLRLYLTCIQEPELVSLCVACPNLESLAAHVVRPTLYRDLVRLSNGKGLNKALLGLSGSLRHLEIITSEPGNYMPPRDDMTDPRLLRLTCLPQLTNLQSLVVDFSGLFGPIPIVIDQALVALPYRFPPNLEDLTLVCRWTKPPLIPSNLEHAEAMVVIKQLKPCHQISLARLRKLTIDATTASMGWRDAHQMLEYYDLISHETAATLRYLVNNSVEVQFCDVWKQFEYQDTVRDSFPTHAQLEWRSGRDRLLKGHYLSMSGP